MGKGLPAGLVRTAAMTVSSSPEGKLCDRLRQHGDGRRRRNVLGVAPKSDKPDVLPALGVPPARRATTAVRHLLPRRREGKSGVAKPAAERPGGAHLKDLARLAVLAAAAAGAAGTTALNTVTYLDMAVRGRSASSTPETKVGKLSEKAHVPVPGDGDPRQNRLQGLGPLTGLVAGIGCGVVLAAARGRG